MIDTHAHIYDPKFAEDFDASLLRAKEAGITKILMPNCAEETIIPMLQCEEKHPEMCIPMMGLHPCYVMDISMHQELDIIKNWLDKKTFCAVGEIGLDYYWDTTFVEEQKYAFDFQIQLAMQHQLPIVVHSRESTPDCIDIAKPYAAKGLTGVFHCFSGTIDEAVELTNLGFYLGIGGVITYKNSNLKEIVKQVPTDKLLLETDAPYLAPIPHRGKRNECAYVKEVALVLADALQLTLAEIDSITTANAEKLFKL